MTLECGHRDVDVPVLDAFVHELAQLQVDRKPGLAVTKKKRKDLHRRPLEGLQHRQVLELCVVQPTQSAVRVVSELAGQPFAGLDYPAVRRA